MVLDSWRRPSGGNMSWFNLKHMLLLSFLAFKLLEWSRATYLPLWDLVAYLLVLGACYWGGFVAVRYLKRYRLSFTVASYKKAVLITGCDSGFGNMLARKLALDRGFEVFAGCLDANCTEARRLATVPNVHVLGMDVTSQEAQDNALRFVGDKLNESGNYLWCIVCNAGVCEVGELEWQSMNAIERILNVNVMGSIRTVRTFLPSLRASKGRIVITASTASSLCMPGFIAYSMSKAAVASLGEGLKRELQVWDVDVCTVQPAGYKTDICHMDGRAARFMSSEFPDLPDNVQEDYGSEYFTKFFERMAKFVSEFQNPHPEEVVEALTHAVTTVWPETHYRVGSAQQLLMHTALDYAPAEFADVFFEKVQCRDFVPNAVSKS